MGWSPNQFRLKVYLPLPHKTCLFAYKSANLRNASDLLFQTDSIFNRLLTEFEQALRDSAVNGLTRARGSGYLNFFSTLGDSHLMNIVQAGSLRVAEPDADGQTILNIFVAQQRALPTIRRIVEAGADPMTIDANGTTSVHLALRLERKDIAWLLLTLWKMKRGFSDAAGAAGSNSADY
jgi:hypothetical protein